MEHFDQVVGDCFMDCVNCLIGFANNKTSHRISLKAIALLRICEDRLAEVCFPLFIPINCYSLIDTVGLKIIMIGYLAMGFSPFLLA